MRERERENEGSNLIQKVRKRETERQMVTPRQVEYKSREIEKDNEILFIF